MSFINEVLILSLKQDLKSVTELVDNILLETGKSPAINSWLFPTKGYGFVNDFIHVNRIFETGSERLFLELIIDRLYIAISLILTHLEEIKNVNVSSSRFIIRPKQFTLGCCLQKFWKLISIIIEDMSNHKTARLDNRPITTPQIHRSAQTEIISLKKCDSCASAMLCMKNILKIFENSSIETGVILRPQIFDITQFGSMMQTTQSVNNTVQKILEKHSAKEQEIYSLKYENDIIKNDIEKHRKRLNMIDEELKIYRDKNDKGWSRVSVLTSENEELLNDKIKNERTIKSLKHIMTNLCNMIHCSKESIQKLQNEKKNMSTQIDNLYVSHRNVWGQLSRTIQKANRYKQDMKHAGYEFQKLERSFKIIVERLTEISKIQTTCDAKIRTITSDYQHKYLLTDENVADLKEKLKNKFLQIATANVQDQRIANNNPTFQVKGNPIEDLSKQIEENEEKIQFLQKENTKLNLLLSKFKCLKSS